MTGRQACGRVLIWLLRPVDRLVFLGWRTAFRCLEDVPAPSPAREPIQIRLSGSPFWIDWNGCHHREEPRQ